MTQTPPEKYDMVFDEIASRLRLNRKMLTGSPTGTLADLPTQAKSSVVAALTEVVLRLDDLSEVANMDQVLEAVLDSLTPTIDYSIMIANTLA